MNAIAFVSAYKQLSPAEREFVDGFLRMVERQNARYPLERMTATLERVQMTLNPDELDSRTNDFLVKPLVRAAIHERTHEIAAERDITPARIIREHAAIATANMVDFVTIGEDGVPSVDMSNVSRADWSAVQQLESEETFGPRGTVRKTKIKLYNKQVSLDTLAKWTGLDKPDSAEFIAYKSLPSDSTAIPASASAETLAEEYAKFIS